MGDDTAVDDCALGLRVHIGWTSVVALAADRILARARIDLSEQTFEAGAVYHMALDLPLEEGRARVERAAARARADADAGLAALVAGLAAGGHRPVVAAFALGGARVPDDLAKILASHALVHAAEAALYREAVAGAAQALGLDVVRYPARDVKAWAKDSAAWLGSIGKVAGRPWSVDQKEPALLARAALSARA